MTVAPRYARFAPETLAFLEALAANNNREWFKENKSRYEEQVLDVALRFIQSMQDPLHEIAPHFVAQATRVGGSLMRVYRDTRFAKNMPPYKTNIGIQFRHELAKDVHSPGTTSILTRKRCLLVSACGVRSRTHFAASASALLQNRRSGTEHPATIYFPATSPSVGNH